MLIQVDGSFHDATGQGGFGVNLEAGELGLTDEVGDSLDVLTLITAGDDGGAVVRPALEFVGHGWGSDLVGFVLTSQGSRISPSRDIRSAPQKMDTVMDTDEVTTQLRKLREGAGLTPARLATFGAVMSALGTSDATEATQRLLAALQQLGAAPEVEALRVDYGLDLHAHLTRPPSTREVRWLGQRREGYAHVVGRDVKTLARWSDRAVKELRSLLIDDTFTGKLYVVAAVDDGRIAGISVIEERPSAAGAGTEVTKRESTDLENPSDQPSIPALIYAMPRDWQPSSLHMAVVFRGQRPDHVWAGTSETLITVPFGAERHELTIDEGGSAACRFVKPSRRVVYVMGWV